MKTVTPGAALNALCPYFTMFPLHFPVSLLRRSQATLVIDPFCGRGTTNLAARLRGSATVGVDSSPVAVAATRAKTTRSVVTADQIIDRAQELVRLGTGAPPPTDEFWRAAYHEETLGELTALRAGLLAAPPDDVCDALRGVVLGALHGPLRADGSSSYLSNQCPRTYAPKPGYATRFWSERGLAAPRADLVSCLGPRARKAFDGKVEAVPSGIFQGDSRSFDWESIPSRFGLVSHVITSPPYYGLRTYRPDQWIREWFLGGPSAVNYTADGQVNHSSVGSFVKDLRGVWQKLAAISRPDARFVMRFGAINNRPIDALVAAKQSIEGSGWRVTCARATPVPPASKRQINTFRQKAKPALSEFDLWCRLAA